MRPRLGPAALFAVLLTGCATAPPRITEAPLPAPPMAWTAPGAVSTELAGDWLATFDDPVLTKLVAEALANNADLHAAAARLEQAHAIARIAGADLLPKANASLSAARRRMNFIGLPVPGAAGGVFSTTNPSYGISIDLSWELDLWGRIRAGKSAALAEVQAAEATLAGARLSLAAQTAKAWFVLSEASSQLALAQETVASFQRAKRSVDRRYQSGSIDALDLRLSRSNVATAQALLAARKMQKDSAARQLEILLGRYPSADLEAAAHLPSLLETAPAGLPAALVSRRPDLILAERRLAAAGARVEEARASLYPRLSLTASGGSSTTEFKELLNTDFKVWNVASNLLQPIFQGGRLRENVRLNQARVREAAEAFGSTLLRAYGEVEIALAAERRLAEREDALTEASHHSAAARELAERQYRLGSVGILPVLEAQRRALQAESERISVRRERVLQRIDLHLALGGTFTIPEPARGDGNS